MQIKLIVCTGKVESQLVSSSFNRKQYLKTNFVQNDFEEDLHLRNKFGIKNLPDPKSFREATSMAYVDDLYNIPSILRKCANVDFNDKNLDNFRVVEVNSPPAIRKLLTPTLYVDIKLDC